MKKKIIKFLSFLIIGITVYGQKNNNCAWKFTVSNVYITENKDSSFSFKSIKDTDWLYTTNSKTGKVKKSKPLSVTDGSDFRKYRLFKNGDYLFLQVKNADKILYNDTLVNINKVQEIHGYTLGADNYKLKDRLNYLDTACLNNPDIPQVFKKDYYLIYTTYSNVSKFTRWYVRKKDLAVVKMETCYKVSPFCPLVVTLTK